jgi:ApeA N-terminal domain 1
LAIEHGAILAEPLLGAWCIDGYSHKHAGVLAIEDGRLQLKLFIDSATAHNNEWHHPTLDALRPPKQTTCIGFTSRAERVTLLRCAQSHLNASYKPADGSALIELTLIPTQAWSGSALVDPGGSYMHLSFTAAGLHNILANARLQSELFLNAAETPLDNALRQQLRAATGADDAYLVYKTRTPKAKINYRGKEFEIEFSTSISESHSSNAGINVQSEDTIHISAPAATIDDLLAVKYEIEQFLSILCIGKFVAQDITVRRSGSDIGAKLLWQLGQDQDVETVERLPHEVLTTLGQRPGITEAAITRWFEASEQRRIARGLVCDTLSENTFSNARFLALAQAWEIIGRELSAHLKHKKSLFSKACDEAGEVLKRYLGLEAAERLTRMLKSNNQPNFRTLVEECLKTGPQYAVSKLCGDATKFAKAVSNTRNLLTHFDFEDDERDDLYHAFRVSLYLTYKMTVLFCILEAQWLRMPLDNLPMMLENNRMAIGAKRPIPE